MRLMIALRQSRMGQRVEPQRFLPQAMAKAERIFRSTVETVTCNLQGTPLPASPGLRRAKLSMHALPFSTLHLAILFCCLPRTILTTGAAASERYFTLCETYMQVVIRVRPPLQRELEGYQPFQNTALVDAGQRKLTVSENAQSIQSGANAADIALVGTLNCFCFS